MYSTTSNNRDVKVLDESGSPAFNVVIGSQPIGVEFTEGGESINVYGESNTVAASATVTIVNYTVPVGKELRLSRVEYSGTNRGEYTVEVNTTVESKQRSYYTNFNGAFEFESLSLSAGDNLQFKVENKSTTMTGDFNANIQGSLRDA